jgi:hypothetical protein
MSGPTFSPDGNWMWNGTEWIPAPPKSNVLPQSSIDEKEVSSVANQSGVDPNLLAQSAPYFDENQDGVLQQSELQQAAMSLSQEPTTPSPASPVVPEQPVMQQPVAPVMPQQPVMQQPVAPVMPQQPVMQQPVAPVMPQQPVMQQPVAPVMPQQPVMQQPVAPVMPQQPVMQEQIIQSPSSGKKGKMIAAISLAMVLLLAGVFYVWNDNLAPTYEQSAEPEFVGKWTSSEDQNGWVELKSDGTACDDEEGCSSQWELVEDDLLKITTADGTTLLINWELNNEVLTLEYISLKGSDGIEQLEDNVVLTYVAGGSAVAGTWTFCTNACAPDWTDTLYNVTLENNGTLIHHLYSTPPYQETTYTIDDERMKWNIVINATLEFEQSGKYEVKGDVLYFAIDKIVTTNNGEITEIETTMAGFVAVNSGALMQVGRTIENYTDIIAQNKPHPSWFIDYLDFAENSSAGESSGGSIGAYEFNLRDAPSAISEDGMDDLLYVEMVQGEDLNWAYVRISISVDGGMQIFCGLYTEDSNSDCTYTTSESEYWNVAYEVLISEGEFNLCGDSFDCLIEVKIENLQEDREIGQGAVTAE